MNYVLNMSRFEYTGASLSFLSRAVDWPLYLFTLLTSVTSHVKIKFLSSPPPPILMSQSFPADLDRGVKEDT